MTLGVALASGVAESRAADKRAKFPRPDVERPYVPQTQRYVVVAPANGANPAAAGRQIASHGPYPWRVYPLPAPEYPWGWFGARWHAQTTTHTSYYGDYRDCSYRTGY